MDPRIVLDDRQVLIQLERLEQATQGAGSLRAMQAIGRYLKTSTQLRFRRQMDPEGTRWLPSLPAIKRGGQTLRDSNRLFRSITWRASARNAEVGTNVVYGPAHQFGVAKIVNVRAHSRRMRLDHGDGASSLRIVQVPAHTRPMLNHRRAFLGFSTLDRSRIFEILQRHILEAAGK